MPTTTPGAEASPTPPELAGALKLYTRDELAALLRCSVSCIDRKTKAGKLRPIRLGGKKVLYSAEMVAADLKAIACAEGAGV
jgi:excisionase family DNA binding protein